VRDRSDRKNLARQSTAFDDRFLFVTTGYNVRSTELNAAIGLVQLDRLPEMLASRAELAGRVAGWVDPIPWLRLVGSERVGSEALPQGWRSHSWMTLPFEVADTGPIETPKVVGLLEDAGIETRPVIAGNLARHPAMTQINHKCAPDLMVSDKAFTNYFMIGCHPFASTSQLEVLESGLQRLAEL
jgi:CDP-6-deoxy-D-xylo-4-hexulose-3-dehydrase